MDVRLGKASAVMRALHHSVVLKRELSRKTKLSMFSRYLFPSSPMSLTFGKAERVQSQVQASEMRFFKKSKELRCLTMFTALQFDNL